MTFKFKTIIITLIILFSVTTITIANTSIFKDVSPEAWYYNDVVSLHEKGIIHGFEDNTFRPDDYVTRAQLSKVVNLIVTRQQEQLAELPSPVSQFDNHLIGVVAKVIPSTVQIRSSNGSQEWSGSGFIIKSTELNKNHILTNHHVIEGATSIEVRLSNGKSYIADVLMTSTSNDIALLSIPEADKLAHLEFTREVKQGQNVLVFGNPYGYTQTVTHGIVSHTNRKGMIQVDAAINYGNSGGVVTNINGQILGMSTSKLIGEDVDNIAFAVKSEVILDFLEGKTVIYLGDKTSN